MTLIDRLSKLDGPDRECDAEIALQNGWHVFPGDNWIGPEGKIVVPEYTRSVDAAIELAKSMLPGWQVNVTRFHEIYSEASIGNIAIAKTYYGHNPAIALCIAILRAKEASHG